MLSQLDHNSDFEGNMENEKTNLTINLVPFISVPDLYESYLNCSGRAKSHGPSELQPLQARRHLSQLEAHFTDASERIWNGLIIFAEERSAN